MNDILDLLIRWAVPIMATSTLSFFGITFKWFKTAKKTIDKLPEYNMRINEDIKSIRSDIKKMNNVMVKNDLAILWSQLTSKCLSVIEDNKCDIATAECIDQLYTRYKELGGNHGMDVLVKQAKALCK